MRITTSLRRCGFIAALTLTLVSCRQQPSDPTSPPGLPLLNANDPKARAFHLQSFHVQHIWAGSGHGPEGTDYRAKVAVFDYSQDNALLAELYFHDSDHYDPVGRHHNSEPSAAKQPYQIHFPMSTLGAMLDTLRTANERVYLYYAHGEWAVGIVSPEAIGSG